MTCQGRCLPSSPLLSLRKTYAYACNFCTEVLHRQLMLFRNELLLHNVGQNNKYTLATYHKSDNYQPRYSYACSTSYTV